jgi:hypothetical protein
VVSPDGPCGVQSDAVGSHLDLATTFLSWAGLDEAEIRERYPALKGRNLRYLFDAPERAVPPRGSASDPGDGALVSWDGLNTRVVAGPVAVVVLGAGRLLAIPRGAGQWSARPLRPPRHPGVVGRRAGLRRVGRSAAADGGRTRVRVPRGRRQYRLRLG